MPAAPRGLGMAALRTDVLIAHQPAYLPWPGYLARLLDVDQLVLLDDVQFTKGGWQNRNYVRGPHGGAQLLTVPVQHRFGQMINVVAIADQRWRARHWRALTQSYGHAPHWPEWQPRLQAIYQRAWHRLADLNEALLQLLLDGFDIPVTLVRSSSLPHTGSRTARLISLCRLTGRTTLRIGTGALSYLDAAALKTAGIAVEVATYHLDDDGNAGASPRQGIDARTGEPVPLSALDLLLHHGPQARHLLAAAAHLDRWTTSGTIS
ncbi:WbqC family protein [Nonomuraea sp. NPDC049695]|uniref:WbqC family protein n=1 Tax=Nonomuraea sp. NPDC049695 TaxID=3154734 RepID=UPI00342C073D